MDVLEAIKARRIMLGLKQEDLAEMTGVSLATIKDIDRGVGNPSLRILERIVEVLGMEIQVNAKCKMQR